MGQLSWVSGPAGTSGVDDNAFDTNAFSTDAWDFFAAVVAFVRSVFRTFLVAPDPRTNAISSSSRDETPKA